MYKRNNTKQVPQSIMKQSINNARLTNIELRQSESESGQRTHDSAVPGQRSTSENVNQASLIAFLSSQNATHKAVSEASYQKCLIDWLKKNGVKVIATDFDLTMLTAFAVMATAEGMLISVVTFSDVKSIPRELEKIAIGGEYLVASCLATNKYPFPVDSIYAFYPKNYKNYAAYSSLGLTEPMTDSKSYHLHQISARHNLLPQQILLIDDSITNCIQAVREGFLALHVSGKAGFKLSELKAVLLKD